MDGSGLSGETIFSSSTGTWIIARGVFVAYATRLVEVYIDVFCVFQKADVEDAFRRVRIDVDDALVFSHRCSEWRQAETVSVPVFLT